MEQGRPRRWSYGRWGFPRKSRGWSGGRGERVFGGVLGGKIWRRDTVARMEKVYGYGGNWWCLREVVERKAVAFLAGSS